MSLVIRRHAAGRPLPGRAQGHRRRKPFNLPLPWIHCQAIRIAPPRSGESPRPATCQRRYPTCSVVIFNMYRLVHGNLPIHVHLTLIPGWTADSSGEVPPLHARGRRRAGPSGGRWQSPPAGFAARSAGRTPPTRPPVDRLSEGRGSGCHHSRAGWLGAAGCVTTSLVIRIILL